MLIAVISFCSNHSLAATDIATEKSFIGNVMVRNSDKGTVVLIDKSEKKLYDLSVKGDNLTTENTFPIIYGINEGDKIVSGDGKTPEGIYYIKSWIPGSSLVKQYGNYGKIYGAGAFPLTYPNPVDKIRKKTGYGIWIHGIDPEDSKETTQGCVAMHNDNLAALHKSISAKDPVIITDKILLLTKDEYNMLRNNYFNIFDGFIKSWQENDYNTFKNYIHKDFKGQGKNASAYLASKKYLMNRFKDRVIKTDNTKIFIQNNYNFLIDTQQFYCAQNITSYGNKRYYFTVDNGQAKLISEEATSLNPNNLIYNYIQTFLQDWADAWRSADPDKYITFYSDNFKNGWMNKNDWYTYKKSLFEKAGVITLEITNITWNSDNNIYKASFKQKYSGGTVSDFGTKTIVFEGCPGSFKIISETWKAN